MEIPCDYLATDWTGIPWVRYEQCYIIDGKVNVGFREPRLIQATDMGRCRDDDPTPHIRYRLSEYEWICLRK